MTTGSLAVSKPVSWACLEKFQNLRRAFRVNDLSDCGGSFSSVDLTVDRAGQAAVPAVKDSGWKEFRGSAESARQGPPKFPRNHAKG